MTGLSALLANRRDLDDIKDRGVIPNTFQPGGEFLSGLIIDLKLNNQKLSIPAQSMRLLPKRDYAENIADAGKSFCSQADTGALENAISALHFARLTKVANDCSPGRSHAFAWNSVVKYGKTFE